MFSHQMTEAEVEVLRAYALNHKNYRSMTVEEGLKDRGYLQWKNQNFTTGLFELSEMGRQALLERGILA